MSRWAPKQQQCWTGRIRAELPDPEPGWLPKLRGVSIPNLGWECALVVLGVTHSLGQRALVALPPLWTALLWVTFKSQQTQSVGLELPVIPQAAPQPTSQFPCISPATPERSSPGPLHPLVELIPERRSIPVLPFLSPGSKPGAMPSPTPLGADLWAAPPLAVPGVTEHRRNTPLPGEMGTGGTATVRTALLRVTFNSQQTRGMGLDLLLPVVPHSPTGCPTEPCPHCHAQLPISLHQLSHSGALIPGPAPSPGGIDSRAGAALPFPLPVGKPGAMGAPRPSALTFRNNLCCDAAGAPGSVAMAKRQRSKHSAITERGSGSPAAPPRPRRAPAVPTAFGAVAVAPRGRRAGVTLCHRVRLGHLQFLCCTAQLHPHSAQPEASSSSRADPSASSGLLAFLVPPLLGTLAVTTQLQVGGTSTPPFPHIPPSHPSLPYSLRTLFHQPVQVTALTPPQSLSPPWVPGGAPSLALGAGSPFRQHEQVLPAQHSTKSMERARSHKRIYRENKTSKNVPVLPGCWESSPCTAMEIFDRPWGAHPPGSTLGHLWEKSC